MQVQVHKVVRGGAHGVPGQVQESEVVQPWWRGGEEVVQRWCRGGLEVVQHCAEVVVLRCWCRGSASAE